MTASKKLGIALTASDSFVRDLKKALSIPAPVLLDIAQYVNTEMGIEIQDEEELLSISRKAGLSSKDLSSAYNVLKHIFQEAFKEDIDTSDLLDELSSFCKERSIAGFAERSEALRVFLTPKPQFLKRRRFADYAFGVVPVLGAISGVVQLRAVYKEKRSADIVGYVPVVQVRLRAECADAEKDNFFVFQVDEHGLNKLLKGLGDYQSQLRAMKTDVEGKIEVYTRPEKEDKE